MTRRQRKPTSEMLARAIISGIQEVKGHDIVCLDLREIQNPVSDFFIVCHGTSNTQVEAIARSIERETETTLQESPNHVEGKQNAKWILMDYFNVVVHIFDEETRKFYALEELWADAQISYPEVRSQKRKRNLIID